MTTEAERIAKGLSRRQKAALTNDREMHCCWWRTAVALRRRGLEEFAPMRRTALGEAAAAALRAQENRDEG